MKKILFVCTGNVFRSMTAEKCLKSYLDKNSIKGYDVDSAGIAPIPQDPLKTTLDRLEFHGVKVINHKHKKITKEMVDSCDLIIPMDLNHQKYIKEYFNLDVSLYNEILKNEHTGVHDFDSQLYIQKEPTHLKAHSHEIVDYIFETIPKLFEKIKFVLEK